ncbi:hypothetical protein, partial [Falsiroseomonas sp. CW058]|uniref:hypothetical protein n=1 Tax=Falsiroseomonas sp. CW058 TaxID=3388664 RepID=UPI003D320FFC
MADRALLAGGRAHLLPAGAEPIAPLPLSPAPLAAPGLLGLAVVQGRAVPVLAPAGPGPAWVLLDMPAGRVVLVGEDLADAPPDASPLVLPCIGARPPPPALPAGVAAGTAMPPAAAMPGSARRDQV